jgi:hypothetical protein
MGDVMAVLAECQNRQDCGVDFGSGLPVFTARLFPTTGVDHDHQDQYYLSVLEELADDVSVKVVKGEPWSAGEVPAFSLRRVHPPTKHTGHLPTSNLNHLYDLVAHDMPWLGSNTGEM